jgi:hypothetical protein
LSPRGDIAGWLSHVHPEAKIARHLEKFIGPSKFREQYGAPEDVRYKQALEEFRKRPDHHVQAYYDFPAIEAWIEGGFSKQFTESERGRIRARLAKEGTSSQEFEQWFLTAKYPKLQKLVHQQGSEKGQQPGALDPMVRAAASTKPE